MYIHNDESDQLQTPEANYETWTKYEVTRTVRQSVIAASDPGRIIAGSNLTITANTVLNDDSHIIAGACCSRR